MSLKDFKSLLWVYLSLCCNFLKPVSCESPNFIQVILNQWRLSWRLGKILSIDYFDIQPRPQPCITNCFELSTHNDKKSDQALITREDRWNAMAVNILHIHSLWTVCIASNSPFSLPMKQIRQSGQWPQASQYDVVVSPLVSSVEVPL